jgi:hypothetical protein
MKERGPPCQGGPGASAIDNILDPTLSHTFGLPSSGKMHAMRQLELLALRSFDLADRVAANELTLADAVDLAYDAALWTGLPETVGDDVVQAVLAVAFAPQRRRL